MALPEPVTRAVARTPLVFGTAPLATGFRGNDETTAVAAVVEGSVIKIKNNTEIQYLKL